MDINQAMECAMTTSLPGFLVDDAALTNERLHNEEALSTLLAAWSQADAAQLPFQFGMVRNLADRNRQICDSFGSERLHDLPTVCLQRRLPDEDLIRAVATLQHRDFDEVAKIAGPDLSDLSVAWLGKPVSGMVVGVDIETTDRDPARGYIINIGLEFMTIEPNATPHDPFSGYFGLPDMYAEKGVPLTHIHKITWSDVEGQKPFRENTQVQAAILAAMEAYPYMAHNAAFEDSWFMLHVNGYAEARKEGRITIVDTRDVCRRVDPEVRTLPRESRPAALESWAHRRGTLKAGEVERHLGLDDVELMLATVLAEFGERNMLAS